MNEKDRKQSSVTSEEAEEKKRIRRRRKKKEYVQRRYKHLNVFCTTPTRYTEKRKSKKRRGEENKESINWSENCGRDHGGSCHSESRRLATTLILAASASGTQNCGSGSLGFLIALQEIALNRGAISSQDLNRGIRQFILYQRASPLRKSTAGGRTRGNHPLGIYRSLMRYLFTLLKSRVLHQVFFVFFLFLFLLFFLLLLSSHHLFFFLCLCSVLPPAARPKFLRRM